MISRWISINDGRVRIEWEKDSTWTSELFEDLLQPRFKFTVVSHANGAVVRRRGGTHPAPPAPNVAAQVGAQRIG